MKQGRNFKFPTPEKVKVSDRTVSCTSDYIINLYNQAHGTERVRMTDTIKSWFIAESQGSGWAGCHFLPDFQTGHSGGCVLFTPPREVNVNVLVNDRTLVLNADT